MYYIHILHKLVYTNSQTYIEQGLYFTVKTIIKIELINQLIISIFDNLIILFCIFNQPIYFIVSLVPSYFRERCGCVLCLMKSRQCFRTRYLTCRIILYRCTFETHLILLNMKTAETNHFHLFLCGFLINNRLNKKKRREKKL